MKKFFSVFAVGVLLLSNSNLLLAYESSTDDSVTQRFINVWENGITSEMNEKGFYIDTNHEPQVCDQNNIERGCVRYATRQEAGDFYPDGATLDLTPKNVQIRKMVLPTNKTGEFNIQLMVRGKESTTSTSSNAKICSVVVFDKSNTMLTFSSSSHQYEPGDKWYKAASGAIEYSDVLLDSNVFSKVGLVFFGTTGSVVQDLTGERFEDSDFNITRGDARTDIDFGLLKAGEMLNSSNDYCDKKYIVLMTDGDANAYMSGGLYGEEKTDFNDTTIPVAETIKDANILKNSGIEIFTIGYQVPSSAETTLLNIATDSGHFLKADSDNIIDKFRKTLYSQINYPYTKLVSIKDSLGEKIALDNGDDDINITEEVNITSSGIVYSFPIRIDPTASGWVNTNSGLTFEFINLEGESDSLSVSAGLSSYIYWTQPKCDGNYPDGDGVLTGEGEFSQSWIDSPGGVVDSNSDIGCTGLCPKTKMWTGVVSNNPGECEWTCLPGYQLNQNSDGCEEVSNTYTVKYVANGATEGEMSDQEVEYGKTVTLNKNNYKKEGYTFSGWNTDIKGHGTWYRDEAEVRNLVDAGESITLYAQWTANKYTVKFNGNLSTAGSMNDQEMTYDQTEPLSENRYVREGYEFGGWNTKADGSGTGYDDKALVTNLATSGNITLYAQRSANTYTVKYVANGATEGEMSDQEVEYGKTVTLNKNNYKKEGYTFSGWNTDSKGNGTGYRDEAEVSNLVDAGESITLYAQWTANKYTVKFNGNLSTAGSMNDQEMTYDQTEPLNENRYVREGYEFGGWNTKADGSGTGYDDKALVTNLATSGNITLYAQRSANTYMVEFNGNGATEGEMSGQKIEYGETVALKKNNYKKEGYTFLGWNTQQNGSGKSYGDQQSVSNLVTSGSITLYAQRGINTYVIEFDGNGATAGSMTSQPVEFGNSVKLYKNSFEKEGYTFSGWNTKADGSGIGYDDEALVNNLATDGTVVLYAQWNPNSYTVVFEGNGATSGSTNDQNIVYDDTDTLNKGGFGRIGYTFRGWNTEPDGSGTGYDDEASVTNLATSGVVTLYVQWEPNPYTIIFNGNGSTTGVMVDESMVYDVERNLYENKFVKEGYVFNGWNTKLDGSGKHYSDKSLVKNLATEGTVVLYAQWKPENSGGSSGGGTKKKDDCPNGDYSGDYYDKKCGTKVNTGKTEEKVEDKPVVVPVKTDPTKKCSVEGSKHSKEVNEAYVWACENGIIKSNTIQGAKLGEFLNRAEMAKIVTVFETRILDAVPNKTKDCSAFADSISGYNSEMKNYMVTSCQLERMGIHTANHKPIKDFMPRKFVSRAEFGTILSRILWGKKHEASKNSSKYYVEHLNSLKNDNILNNIDPTLKERRSYAVLMVYRAAKSLGKA